MGRVANTLILIQQKKESTPIPFGPWLALAGFIGFIWREDIIRIMGSYYGLT